MGLLVDAAQAQGIAAHPSAGSVATTFIYDLIRSGDEKKLSTQLDDGLNCNDSVAGYTYLMLAALCGTTEQMKLLMACGADINRQNHDSLTALWLAVPDFEKSRLLINAGADIHTFAKGGITLLQKLAMIPGSLPLIKLLVERGADLQKNNNGNTLMYRSTVSGDTSIASFFIQAGFDVNAPDATGNYPIVGAAQYHCTEMVPFLLQHGARVNVASKTR
jgi:ankyrin repeat protein